MNYDVTVWLSSRIVEKEFFINSPIAIKSERYRVEWKPSFYSTENSAYTARVEGNSS